MVTDWRVLQQGISHVDATVTLEPRHGTQCLEAKAMHRHIMCTKLEMACMAQRCSFTIRMMRKFVRQYGARACAKVDVRH
jgi:hypothetical protein